MKQTTILCIVLLMLAAAGCDYWSLPEKTVISPDGDADVDMADPDSDADPDPDDAGDTDMLPELEIDGDVDDTDNADDPADTDPDMDEDAVEESPEETEPDSDPVDMEEGEESGGDEEPAEELPELEPELDEEDATDSEEPPGECFINDIWYDHHQYHPTISCLYCDKDGSGGDSDWSVDVGNGWCYIDETCIAEYTINPHNECQRCDLYFFSTRWASIADGTACGTDDQCVGGQCEDCYDLSGCSDLADDGLECSVPECLGNTCVHDLDAHVGENCGNGPETCSGQDTCADTGVCLPNHEVMDGTSCDDGDKCNGINTCTGGACLETSPAVTCTALDECHVAGACNPETGVCSNPNQTDGTPCNDDNNACNGVYACQSGVCSETTAAVTCTALDECHVAGTCNPETGVCSNPNQTDGTPCDDDNNACNGVYACQSGVCSETMAAVTCTALDECHVAGVCNPQTGICSNPNQTDGTPCDDDGDPCTTQQQCSGGVCLGTEVDMACADSDHDRVCPYDACGIAQPDVCPTVWNPDNSAAACVPWSGVSAGFNARRQLQLSEDGADSTWRRTHEPVEIPLVNGIIDDSVVGYWKLDNGEAIDYSGNGNHGTLSDPAPVAGTGAFGDTDGAMVFDGVEEYVTIPHNDKFSFGSGSYSISSWIKTSVVPDGSWHVILSKHNSEYNHDKEYAVYLLGGTCYPQVELSNGSGGFERVTLETGACDNVWHNVTLVKNADYLELFFDGTLAGAISSSFIVDDNDPINIGRSYYGGGQGYFHGSIDDVLIFNRALSPDEIAAYYRSRQPYGTKMLPGVQDDFDDIRVTESSTQVAGATAEHIVPHEISGPRPHSDSACPAQYETTPVADIPHIADREDLCGVVGYWKLDGNAVDSSGNGHHGTNNGASPTRGRFGDNQGAMGFDGNDDYIDTGYGNGVILSGITIEAWIRSNETGAGFSDGNFIAAWTPVCGGEGAEGAIRVYGAPDGKVEYQLHDKSIVSVESYDDGAWHHLAIIYDSDRFYAYVDGIEIGAIEENGHLVLANDFFIGKRPAGCTDENVNASIDEVLIHNVAKSPEYIYRRANPGLPTLRFLGHTEPVDTVGDGSGQWPFMQYWLNWGNEAAALQLPIMTALDQSTQCYGLLSPCTGYAGWWRFNEGSGAVAVDSSSNKNNGVIHGNPAVAAGREGVALQFDGADDYVEIPHKESLSIDRFALEYSAKPETIVTRNTVINKGRGGDPHNFNYKIKEENNQLVCTFEYDSGSDVEVWSSGNITTEDFYSGVAIYNGVSLDIYTNHEQGGSIDSLNTPAHNDKAVIIGAGYDNTDTTNDLYNGTLDSVRIMNRALEPDEFLHYPMASVVAGGFTQQDGTTPLDTDNDGIPDDGDGSLAVGDNPCTGGQTANCDDNCPQTANEDQADANGDGVGDVCENGSCEVLPNGVLCDDDGNACNGISTCQEGSCVMTVEPVTCTAQDECHVAGVCDTVTGVCSNPAGNEGQSCMEDNNICTGTYACLNGICTETAGPIDCGVHGTCEPLDGTCSCDAGYDGSNCDQCQNGWCRIENESQLFCIEAVDGYCPAEWFYGVSAECLEGTCEQCTHIVFLECNDSSADCDDSVENGCETILGTYDNCQGCGQGCSFGVDLVGICNEERQCEATACGEGYTDCDDNISNGCESSGPGENLNCGACGYNCRAMASTGVCRGGLCYDHFGPPAYWGDCDHVIENGLEVDLRSDANNCGECGYVCPGDGICVNGFCYNSDMTLGDCDRLAYTVYEFDLTADDPDNCGECGYACPGEVPCVNGFCAGGQLGYDCERDYWSPSWSGVHLDTAVNADTACGDCEVVVDCTALDPPQVCVVIDESINSYGCALPSAKNVDRVSQNMLPDNIEVSEVDQQQKDIYCNCGELADVISRSADHDFLLEDSTYADLIHSATYTDTFIEYGACQVLTGYNPDICDAFNHFGPEMKRECQVVSGVYAFLVKVLRQGTSAHEKDDLRPNEDNAVAYMLWKIVFEAGKSGASCSELFDPSGEAYVHCKAFHLKDPEYCSQISKGKNANRCKALVETFVHANDPKWDSYEAFSNAYFLARYLSAFAQQRNVDCGALLRERLYDQCIWSCNR